MGPVAALSCIAVATARGTGVCVCVCVCVCGGEGVRGTVAEGPPTLGVAAHFLTARKSCWMAVMGGVGE